MNRKGDIEPALYTMLLVVLAAGILVLIIYVTRNMFKIRLTFGGG